MCGRVRLISDWSDIKIKLKFDPDTPAPNFASDYNKPPTEPMLVAIRSEEGKRVPRMMRWGLLPYWAKDEKLSYSTFNACRGVHDEAGIPRRLEARPAMFGRHRWFL